jgi:gliding motility-associated-like protein
MRHFSKVLLCTLFSLFIIQNIQAQFTAINNGNWNTPATWQGGVVPTAGADVIIAATVNISHADVTVGDFTINTGGTINSNYPYGIKLNSGKTFTNNGTVGNVFHVTFLGSGLVAGSATSNFTVVNIEGPVDFGTTSTVANLTINAGGSVNTNRPTYRTGSSLNYNTGGTYVIGDEWVTGNTNYPRALTINAGTTLSFGNITTSRRVGGVNDAMNINGGMILSSAAGGDLIITSTYNNFNGTFTANGRTVTCLDGGSNCIIGGSQPVSFDNLVLNLPGKQFNLFTPVTVTTSATFTAGYTVINNSDFIVNSGVTITGASANCYAYTNGAGRLVMKGVGAGPVVAPIGRNIGNVFIHYNPVTITNGGGFDYAIKANATAPTGAGILNTTKVIRCQWDITPSGNAANVGLRFQYIAGQGVSGGTFSETAPQRGLRYNTATTSWETIGTATPVGTNPYNVSYTFSGPTWGLFSFESVTPPPPPPTITSFTPTSGPVGTTVTITGTNFNTTVANNIVFFGATKATVTAATATSLTVTVPVGATFDNIIVVNMGSSLLAHSNANFTPTFTPNKNSIATTDFDPKIEIATGTGTTWPYQVALGDIDGDGKADLVVANRANSTVAVFRNTSTSGTVSFATRQDFSTAQEPRGLALVDLDGDGKLDIATTGGNLNQVAFTVLRNTSTSGTISFATKIETNTTAATYSIASADIDGDGKEDLIFGGPKMIIYPNTSTVGNITFATPIDYTAAVNVNAIAIADLDGDAKKDICFTAGANVSVFRNTSTIGAISLATKIDFAAPQAYGITIGDWDGDGKLDIAASLLNTTNTLSILTNTSTVGNISFATRIDNSSPQNPYFVAGGDLNGDGKADLLTTNAGQNGTAANLSVYRNTSTSGAASFASNVNLALGSWPYYAAIGDIDGDGRPDIVSSSVEANRVDIFRNNPKFQTVVATGTLTAFTSCLGSTSTSQSFTVSGSALTTNLVVTAPAGYEVSTTAGSGYASSVTLTPASGTVASTTIFVRLAATATGSPSGNITVASTGATTQNVAVTGTVNSLPAATITAGGATTFCQGGSVVLTANAGSSYLWSNNATTQSITATTSGNYTVAVTNASGCSTTSAVRTVTVNPLPVLTVTATPTNVSRGFNTQLNVTGSNLGTFAWTPTANLSSTTIANPIARVMSTTTYTVTVASSAGCTASGNVTVTAIDDLNITSTNVFTPNGDGINDKFVIKNLDAYPNNKLQVMDRTGKVIFEKQNYANDWNGTVNGRQLLTKETYFFVLIVNGQVLKKGSVTLVR